MATVIEELRPTTTDPDILKARYRFERLVEQREAKKNGMKWMRKEVLQAFESYRSSAGYNKDFEHDFVRLDFQCLIYGTLSKSYHHYNFTMRTRLSRSKPWTFQQYFAEVKPTENETEYFCCPLQPSEDGHCFGYRKVGISLKHPESGGYEKGYQGSGFPFDTDSKSDD
uniref:Uncharacterized protein n=1 Tax=Avena sativa TaxID=4498 RepID=A0ACD5XZU6_AVESA